MRLLITLGLVVAVLLLLLIAVHLKRRGSAEFDEADRLAAARSVTSLPHQPNATDRK